MDWPLTTIVYSSLAFFAVEVNPNEIVADNAVFVHGKALPDANEPPKVDSEMEILQEKVTKQIIKEGHGSVPSKYSTCFCKCQIIEYFAFAHVTLSVDVFFPYYSNDPRCYIRS